MNFVSYTQIQMIVQRLLDCISNSTAKALSDDEYESILRMIGEIPT